MSPPLPKNFSSIDDDEEKEPPLPPPDPGENGAELLAYIKKRGGNATREHCELKCKEFGLDLDSCLRAWKGKIGITKVSQKKRILELVFLKDKPWVSKWLIHYDLDPPHHGQPQKRRMND